MATTTSKAQPQQVDERNFVHFRPRSSVGSPPTSSSSVSPSSLQSITTTDSDGGNAGNMSPPTITATPPRPPMGPILIKYNYYDYNGERQENHDMMNSQNLSNNNNQRAPIQRQLSPTFKQSLDQILKTRSEVSAAAAAAAQVAQRTSSPAAHTMSLLARRYKLSSYEHRCLRCAKTVYQMDKVGPLKEFTFYHQNCFKCRECGTKLTLKTYFNNQHSSIDLEVYCHRHCPKAPAGRLDNQSVGIRAALNAPKVFDPIHQQPDMQFLHNYQHVNGSGGNAQPQVDSRALHIQHAVQQTRLQAIYKHSQVDKKLSQFLNRRLEYLEPKQKMLEMRHREEEEQLFKVFEQKWLQEETHIRDQIRDEWQAELNKLLDRYKRQLTANLHQTNNSNNLKVSNLIQHKLDQVNNNNARQPQARIDFHRPTSSPANELAERSSIEMERLNLEKTMTIKLDRKKETLKRKLREFERQATAELVEKQSREMLTLISSKLEEFKEEQKRKIGASDLEHFEAIESLANQLGASLQLQNTAAGVTSKSPPGRQPLPVPPTQNNVISANQTAAPEMPPPRAPQVSKMELYNSEQVDEVFREIDQLAINVAREDQRTFTDLVHHLTRHSLTDVEKVRAIFRWITVKNLNTMQFDDATIKADTPLGLLRGIKQGSESYHVLFKRLCSYAGLHCVVIKGYSKSAGYQPGVRFETNRFRNSWNAVYVAGAWRFVQCNWGARHLVSVAVMQDKNNSPRKSSPSSSPISSSGSPSPATTKQVAPSSANNSDSLRYEYDDHYFLTDPDEFIYEFFPLAPEWQLLNAPRPISLNEFEQLPFVRSLFFKYGLYFAQPDKVRSVLHTNSSGATTIKIGMPTHMVPSLIFHYNLKYFDSDLEHTQDGISLKRFVMQSVESTGGGQQDSTVSNVVSFRVHVPEDGAYILDIFANSTTPRQYITGEPMKFKSVCKFKIIAKQLRTCMVPLPDCASGEYGPMKATRLFGIIPLTHESGLISVGNEKRFVELQFRMTRPLLDFMASLHKNNHDERQLSKLIKIFIDGDIVIIAIKFLDDGQYGLDIYTRDQQQVSHQDLQQQQQAPKTSTAKQVSCDPQARDVPVDVPPKQKQLLTHCCKYLINVRATTTSI